MHFLTARFSAGEMEQLGFSVVKGSPSKFSTTPPGFPSNLSRTACKNMLAHFGLPFLLPLKFHLPHRNRDGWLVFSCLQDILHLPYAVHLTPLFSPYIPVISENLGLCTSSACYSMLAYTFVQYADLHACCSMLSFYQQFQTPFVWQFA